MNPVESLIIGAGPAGLTAAYELAKHGITETVIESDSVVGGLARTVERDGNRFDIGGHRFFTKVKETEDLWDKMLGEPMLLRPDPRTSCLGLEYFVSKGDELWSSADDVLIRWATEELRAIGLSDANIVKGFVVRVPKAYPVYDPGYRERLEIIRRWLESNVANLYCIGRNGQHRYNNQDHSMATALIAARNVACDEARDPWAVNEDAEYHEIAATERQAPRSMSSALVEAHAG